MKKKTIKQINFEKIQGNKWEQLKMFIQMCKFAKVNGAFGGNGITKQDLYDKGMTDDIFNWLKKYHYCNEQKEGKPLWIAINGNRFYPEQTVQNLEKSMQEFEKNHTK